MKIFVCLPCCLLDFNCGLQNARTYRECYIEKELEQNPNQEKKITLKEKNKSKMFALRFLVIVSKSERDRYSLKCVEYIECVCVRVCLSRSPTVLA